LLQLLVVETFHGAQLANTTKWKWFVQLKSRKKKENKKGKTQREGKTQRAKIVYLYKTVQ